MLWRTGVLVGLAAVFVTGALAAATPITPPPGATLTTPHVHFSWTLPANERTQAIFFASKADVGPDGHFRAKNMTYGEVLGDVHEWTALIYAGHSWWQIYSSDRSTQEVFYSAPVDFTVPLVLGLAGVKTKPHRSRHALKIVVHWTANVERPLVRASILRRGKVVWTAREAKRNPLGKGSTSFSWYRPRKIKQGTRLTIRASISSAGVKRTRAVVARAP
jgi:hypothetical protein